jgi:flagellar biosynthesis/type III secretory pathway protein FliH
MQGREDCGKEYYKGRRDGLKMGREDGREEGKIEGEGRGEGRRRVYFTRHGGVSVD